MSLRIGYPTQFWRMEKTIYKIFQKETTLLSIEITNNDRD